EIKYFLPEGATNSNIYVFNMQGNLLLTYNLTNNGFGRIEINGSSLSAGMYIYTLTINGKEVETKRMILTK
ncbi:MAG: T9SS type A sorting domain-containing protein, partial [Bacteroidales bacterium]